MSGYDDDLIAPGRVAVVTGAASGIGLALTKRFLAEGMRVVMADVEETALDAAVDEVPDHHEAVLPVVTDVSDADQVEALLESTLTAFGAVHVVCNNAGVGGPHSPIWEIARGDLEWVLRVNVWGVINGIRTFVPALLRQGEGHVVNTASVFGLFAGTLGIYGVSKHAVVALSEALHLQLREAGSSIGVTVLCPGPVHTNFPASARNRPADLGPATEEGAIGQASIEKLDSLVPTGRPPEEVAQLVVDAVRESRFYVLTSSNRIPAIQARFEAILSGAAPTPPLEVS
jgi:NAD(P)-dependent dehydrogenase (short-subunit alcohol dehydrogenase family)